MAETHTHTIQVKILLLLSKSNQIFTQKELIKHLKISRMQFYRDAKELEKIGFIEIKGNKSQRFYQLTMRGKGLVHQILHGYHEEPFTIRKHATIFKAPLIRISPSLANTWIPFQMRNWQYWQRQVYSVWVRITTQNVFFYMSEQIGADIYEMEGRDRKLVEKIREELKKENIIFGDIKVVRQEWAILKDPFAEWCKKQGISFRDKIMAVDNSTGKGELEFVNNETAIEDLDHYFSFVRDITRLKIEVQDLVLHDQIKGSLDTVRLMMLTVNRQNEIIEFIIKNPLLRLLWEIQAKAEKSPETPKTQTKKP